MNHETRNLLFLTGAFAALLTGVQTVQQYVTVRFDAAGDVSVGYTSLFIAYLMFFLGTLVAPFAVAQWGAKRCFLGAAVFYTAFAVSVGIGVESLLYVASVLVGISAGILWGAYYVYMAGISSLERRGRNAGVFWAAYSATTGIGLIASGPLIESFSIDPVIFGYAGVCVVGLILFVPMDDVRATTTETQTSWRNGFPIIGSLTVMRLASCIFVTNLTYGLAISFLPLEIAEIAGTEAVGWMSAMFFVIPAVTSVSLGQLADKLGRFFAVFSGLGVSLAGLGILYFAHTSALLFIGILVITLGFSILNPVMTALPIDISPEGMTERVTGTFNALTSVGISVGIAIPFLIADKTVYIALGTITVLNIVIILPLARKEMGAIRELVAVENGRAAG